MKKLRIGLLVCLSLALLSGVAVMGAKMIETKHAYITIDGDSVSEEELRFYMTASRADTISRFAPEAAAGIDKAFWETGQNGVTPAEYLTEAAVESLQNDRALFAECEKRGLCERLDYAVIIRQMNAENAQRSEKRKNGEPVYGVTSYTVTTYYDYLKSNLKLALREALESEGVLSADELALKQYYDQIKADDPLFRNADGSFKPYADVSAKVRYLYREDRFAEYIEQAAKGRSVRQNTERLHQLAAEIG